jgi:hypothetical protein
MDQKRIVLTSVLLTGLSGILCCTVTSKAHSSPAQKRSQTMSLAGVWRFESDPKGVGHTQKWYRRKLQQTITLPGSMAENGFGNDPGLQTEWTGTIRDPRWYEDPRYKPYTDPNNFKFPFWLQPVKHYVGPAWYQREFVVPSSWKSKRVRLFLERCHWQTTLWLDGKPVGTRNSLSTPHIYELGVVKAGDHTITLCVDNTVKIDVGVNAHSVTDHTQTNWNGIVGRMELQATDAVWIEDVQVYPHVAGKTARVRVTVKNSTGGKVHGELALQAESFNGARPHKPMLQTLGVTIHGHTKSIETEYAMGSRPLLWDEFSPNLYRLLVRLTGEAFADETRVIFGVRDLSVKGTQFAVNGRRIFLRGTLECCIFPRTGYPPTDVKHWARIIKTAKAYGLNHIRFHSWCPPEAAFTAADRAGFYYQIEGPFWATVGDGREINDYVYAECDRILRTYGNHPSFCFMAYGNEPGGAKQREFLGRLVTRWKGQDSRHLYTSASGWPIIAQSDYYSTPRPRIQQWGEGLRSRINAEPPETQTDYSDFVRQYDVPVVSHEMGQWCVYPNFAEVHQYTGVTKPRNFEIFRAMLKDNHMLEYARDFLMASGKLQTLCYKEDIETALRTKGLAGFQLLDLHDFPGQGTALVGVLDPFWQSKGYVTSQEFNTFCSQTVLLARMDKRIWTNDETFRADVEIAHFGPAPFEDAVVTWSLATHDGHKVAEGSLDARRIPIANGTAIGTIAAGLSEVTEAGKLVLEVSLQNTDFSNRWDIWVFPRHLETEADEGTSIVAELSERVLDVLAQGGKVLLLPAQGAVRGDKYGKVPPAFSPIFWNTAWTNRQPPHTLGILCDPAHPALAQFPTEYHSNWQWWYLITNSQIMILDGLPPHIRPVVRVIDDWFTARRLGLILEARVGQGKLLVCSMDLRSDLEHRPVARQMLHSLLEYMSSEEFTPQFMLEPAQLKSLFEEPTTLQALGAKVLHTDSQEPDTTAQMAFDGGVSTIWHTQWRNTMPDYRHEIILDLGKTVTVLQAE